MHRIMVIDDSLVSLAAAKKVLEDESYIVQAVNNGMQAMIELKNMTELPDLILLDVEMPEINGFETLKKIKDENRLKNIPVIFLTGSDNHEAELEGLLIGAVDYIMKPFLPPLLKQRVSLHLQLQMQKNELARYNKGLEEEVKRKTESITNLQNAMLYSMADLIDVKDGYTGGHVKRVSQYVRILLNELKKRNMLDKPEDIDLIVKSSLLHDMGKISIEDSILLKNGILSNEEFEIMKSHTTIGAKSLEKSMILVNDDFSLKYAHDIAKYHHEKWNGKGYPCGLKGEKIPFIARVTSIADVYDALRSKRTYKPAMPHEIAVEVIKSDSGQSFDPKLVEIFLAVEMEFEMVLTRILPENNN